MKIIICYPPLSSEKGYPTLGQNRQFQFFKEPTYIYPVVPAQAATLLRRSGYQVVWLDCIAERVSYDKFIEIILEENPDLIAFETKTPVVKQHWKIIDDIKGLSPQGTVPITVLFGDHVTALPEESLQNSMVDFVLTGGDYDFLLLNLCNFIEIKGLSPQCKGTVPAGDCPYVKGLSTEGLPAGRQGTVPESIKLEPGIYYRDNGQIKNSGAFKLDHDLNTLPFIDRDLTKWKSYAYNNGNYKLTPGTYIMSGRDCWWGRCTFCSWPMLYPQFRVRKVDNVLDEIGMLIEQYRVREIMDDTGSFPVGEWLKSFCQGLIRRGYHRKIYLDCNMRFGTLTSEDFLLMKKANFRLLLFGLESANQETLDRVNKNLKVEDIIEGCKMARRAGLYPHITVMFGYPWETYEDACNTLNLGEWLLRKGYAYTMQATVVIPYPGTPLFKECQEKGLLNTLDWDAYDMKQPVMRTSIPDEKVMGLVKSMYSVSFQPEFIFRKFLSMKDIHDLKYYLRVLKKVSGHIFDFRHKGEGSCSGQ